MKNKNQFLKIENSDRRTLRRGIYIYMYIYTGDKPLSLSRRTGNYHLWLTWNCPSWPPCDIVF